MEQLKIYEKKNEDHTLGLEKYSEERGETLCNTTIDHYHIYT